MAELSRAPNAGAYNDMRVTKLIATLALLGVLLAGCSKIQPIADGPEEVAAKVSVVVDCSDSFAKYLPEVQRIVISFLLQNAVQGDAEVYLYRLDARPRLVTRLRASVFVNKNQFGLIEALQTTSVDTGTDVVSAIEMAAAKLGAKSDTTSTRRFLLVFTDGHVDPAKNPCYHRAFRQLSDLQTEILKGVRARFFFLSPGPYKELQLTLERGGVDALLFEPGEPIDARRIRQMVEGS